MNSAFEVVVDGGVVLEGIILKFGFNQCIRSTNKDICNLYHTVKQQISGPMRVSGLVGNPVLNYVQSKPP